MPNAYVRDRETPWGVGTTREPLGAAGGQYRRTRYSSAHVVDASRDPRRHMGRGYRDQHPGRSGRGADRSDPQTRAEMILNTLCWLGWAGVLIGVGRVSFYVFSALLTH